MSIELLPKNIYVYKDNNDQYQIGVYLGETDVRPYVFVAKLVSPQNEKTYIKFKNLDKVYIPKTYEKINKNSIEKTLFIKGKEVFISMAEFNLIIQSIIEELSHKYSIQCNETLNKNMYESSITDPNMIEKMLRFLEWTTKKEELKFNDYTKNLEIVKNRIYFAYLGSNIGAEIEKLRPVLVWKEHINKNNKNDNSYFVFPLTTKLVGEKYYYNYPITINNSKILIKLNDGKRISIKRFLKPVTDKATEKVVELNEKEIKDIKRILKKFFSI